MTSNIKEPPEHIQDQSEQIERFILYKFDHALKKGIKARVKSFGCFWNHTYQGWLCPVGKSMSVQKELDASQVLYSIRSLRLTKGLISTDPRIAGKQTRLDILEEQYYKEENALLVDVVSYDSSLRPIDFSDPPSKEEKSPRQIQLENDLHLRVIDQKLKKEEIDKLYKDLSSVQGDSSSKIVDREAPLLIADMIIRVKFHHEEHQTLIFCANAFWHWSGLKYEELQDVEIRKMAYNFLRDAKELKSSGEISSFNPSKYRVDQIMDALRAILYQRHQPTSGAAWLDHRLSPDAKSLIPFNNGLLSLKEWLQDSATALLSHTPLLFNTNVLPYDFTYQTEEPIAWLEFIQNVWPNDPESQSLLQEWIGYLLLPDTSMHKILLMVGPTRSGKGTIGRILQELLGHANVVGPTLSGLSGEFGLQPLQNKTLALIADARLDSRGSKNVIIERLLSISGEDPLTINRKFLPAITVQLPTRIMMMSNELPDMKDASGALANRYLVLTMKKSWLGKEDPSLFYRLKQELPGILMWALQGLARLKERGHFVQPSNSLQTVEELQAMTSPIKGFVSERCYLKSGRSVAVSALFEEWCSWCLSTGQSNAGTIQTFGKKLNAAFPELEITRPQEGYERERRYRGISLKEALPASADVRGH